MYDPPEALPNSVPTLWLPFGAGAGIGAREARREAKEGVDAGAKPQNHQSIMIGDAIRVIVVGFDGDQVKLGIEARATCRCTASRFLQRFAKPFFGGAASGLGDGDTLPSP